MRPLYLAILPAMLLATGAAGPRHDPQPFKGAWMTCEEWQGSSICTYKLMAQSGSRLCGVQQYFATNRYYTQRFVAVAKGRVAQMTRICGDPGSETDTYCAGQAPTEADKAGWGETHVRLLACGDSLYELEPGQSATCGSMRRSNGLPRVRSLGNEGPQPGDRQWLSSCIAGQE